MAPQVTIGLPVYNAAPWLRDALRSVFAQSFADWELLVVDDGSRDGSLEIARRLRDPRVHVFADGRHRGLAARLNQIVAAAHGPLVARMDADDLLHPKRLERQISFLADNPRVDGVGCALVILDRQGRPWGLRRVPEEHAQICARPLHGIRLVHATLLARTEWLRRHPYDERNRDCEDWGLWYSSYASSTFANLSEPLYFYREFDSFTLGKYLRARRRLASFLWREGRARWGARKTAARCLGQYLRMGAYLAACGTGLRDQLLRRRSRALSSAEVREFEAVLEAIRATPLPAA